MTHARSSLKTSSSTVKLLLPTLGKLWVLEMLCMSHRELKFKSSRVQDQDYDLPFMQPVRQKHHFANRKEKVPKTTLRKCYAEMAELSLVKGMCVRERNTVALSDQIILDFGWECFCKQLAYEELHHR